MSFVDVLRGRVDPQTWRDGIVFVGLLGAAGFADDYWTPVSQLGLKMSGVEVHGENFYLYRVCKGKISRVGFFASRDAALEAAELPEWSEDEAR